MSWMIDKFETKIEKDISIAMIMSTDFISHIAPSYNERYLRNQSSRIICQWCLSYYETYKEAPKQQIQNIYESYGRSSDISPEILKLIGRFLQELSDEYAKEEKFNYRYIEDQTIEFFDKRSLEILQEDLADLIQGKDYKKAMARISDFKQTTKVHVVGSDIFDKSFIMRIFERKEEPLFKVPRDLGTLLGDFYRDDFIAVAGPMKRGKTWALQYLALEALTQKLNVAFFSMGDMSEEQLGERFFRAFTNLAQKPGTYAIPVFDCKWNQQGSCKLGERKGKGSLAEFTIDWVPCTVCMGTFKFAPTSHLLKYDIGSLSLKAALKKERGLRRHFPGKLNIMSWPRKVAGISDIESTLKIWEWAEGFIPDVIITDYADIMRPETKVSEYRHQLDHIWGEHDALAKSRHCVVITGTQTTRSTLSGKKDVDAEDAAEDVRKMAHVTSMFSLNQSPQDKENQIMRIKMMVSRHDKFLPNTQCIVLQNLDCAQFHLDSCIDKSFQKG